MDWKSSGIRNTFEYEMIDRFDLSQSYGMLEGVTGGSINESYAGDYRCGLSLDVDGAEFPLGRMIRVWHTATLGTETVREVMGTFMLADRPKDYRLGRYTGSLSFQSALYRLGKDRRTNNRGIAAGSNVNALFSSIVSAAGGTPYIPSTFSGSKTLSTAHIWECGESCLTECHRLAQAMSQRGYVMPDVYGCVTVEPYRNPRERDAVFTLGSDCLLIGVSETDAEIVNRVGVSYKSGDTEYFANATVDSSHPWSYENIGYWATKNYTASDLSGNIQNQLDNLAEQYLAENSQALRTFSVQSLYEPLHVGDAGIFDYRDSEHDGIHAKVWLSQRKINLNASMLCELTLEEING